MALSVLYIGGTGQISWPCVEASLAAGHDVTILNRNKTATPLPVDVKTLVGDMNAAAYGELGGKHFDVVAQFRLYTMTERTKLENKFWQYSRDKIACERLLRDQDKLAYTIVRPAHTVRTHMPIEVGDADNAIRRMIAGKPVIVTGDGSSLWTLTRSVDVARAFVRLLGAPKAINDDFHITTDRGFTWNQIHDAIARGFGVAAIHAHVPTEALVAYEKEWEGQLMGDKTWSALYDNSKVKGVVGEFDASQDIDEILHDSVMHARQRLNTPAPAPSAEDRLIDQIISAQASVRP